VTVNPDRLRVLKDTAMKHFGTVQSFNETTGHGFIRPDDGGRDLAFDSSEILWDPMVSPRTGARLSYHLSGRNGHASAINLQLAAGRTSFTIFHSAAEEAATKAEHDEWDNEGGHMSSTSGLVVSTPAGKLPYKVILKHERSDETECSFSTMREAEAYIRRNTPRPIAYNTVRDQEACAL
jgi:cold shock CspA family protein